MSAIHGFVHSSLIPSFIFSSNQLIAKESNYLDGQQQKENRKHD